MVALLARGLIEAGHRVTLIAAPGSRLEGAQVRELAAGADPAPLVPRNADLVHLRATPREGKFGNKPLVVTIDGHGKPGEVFHSNTVFVSRKHAELNGGTRFVHNAVDVDAFRFGATRNGRWAFLAKARWKVKNLVGAIEVARAAGVELDVMGSREWLKLLPRWRGVRYLGMVGDAQKANVLSEAQGLIFPVRWHEPFGLAAIEALASGCPVLATPYGALPEIVSGGVGVLSARPGDLVAAMGREWDREACRRLVREKFHYTAMARAYEAIYREVLEKGSLGAAPRTPEGFRAQELLAWG